MTTHYGGCHCGKVRFRLNAPADIEAVECNCSICRRSGHLHLFVEREDFELLAGADATETYTFNSGIAQHFFCRTCGIKSYYVPRSHPDSISVNVNCLERRTIKSLSITPFDGENWEQNIDKLLPISD
jgi:hypothetical protein